MKAKKKILLFSVFFIVGFALMCFFPQITVFFFGTEIIYSGAQTILDKVNKSEELWFNSMLLSVSVVLTVINVLIIIII